MHVCVFVDGQIKDPENDCLEHIKIIKDINSLAKHIQSFFTEKELDIIELVSNKVVKYVINTDNIRQEIKNIEFSHRWVNGYEWSSSVSLNDFENLTLDELIYYYRSMREEYDDWGRSRHSNINDQHLKIKLEKDSNDNIIMTHDPFINPEVTKIFDNDEKDYVYSQDSKKDLFNFLSDFIRIKLCFIKIVNLETNKEKILIPDVKYYLNYVNYFPVIQSIIDKSNYVNINKNLPIDLHKNIIGYLFGKSKKKSKNKRNKTFRKKK